MKNALPVFKCNGIKLAVVLFLSFLANRATAQCVTINTTITHVACYNGTTGSITVNATGGTGPYQYQLAEAGAGAWQSLNVFTGLNAGAKPVSVKDAAGCITTIYVTVNQPAAALSVASFVGSDATCNNGNNGKINISVAGGTTPYTYNWTKNGSAYSTAANLINLAPANYKLIVTDAAGCTTAPIIVSQEKKIVLTGYNADVIADAVHNTPASSVTTQTVDDNATNTGTAFYAQGYSSTSTSLTNGLPASGAFTSSAGNNFQLAAYNTNNSLRIPAGSSGTFTFAAQHQSSYLTLRVLAAGGNGGPSVDYTVNFKDGSTTAGTIAVEDWFCSSCTPYGLNNLGRITRSTSAMGATTFAIREYPIALSVADQQKIVTGITFSEGSTQTGIANFFGVTGNTSTIVGIPVNDGPIGSSVTPAVTIASDAVSNTTFCSGQTVTFTATPSNEGPAPAYQWKLNGSNIPGATNPTYTTSSLTSGQIISVVLTSSLTCVTASTANSNTLTMTTGPVPAGVTVTNSGTTICSGTSVAFVATPINGGNAPGYQWKVNGTDVPGATLPTYTNSTLTNADVVTVQMTSSIGCASTNPATSAGATMSVTTSAAPTVTITSVPVQPSTGQPVNFSSSITFGGTTPGYQWYKNGNIIAGATGTTLSVPSGVTNDSYSLKLTSTYGCKLAPAAMSNYITVLNTLPVTLMSFTGSKTAAGIQLKWKTAGEMNLRSFVIERSANSNNNFIAINNIAASGIASGTTYDQLDATATSGTYFYRLKMIDKDGEAQYSNIISFSITGTLLVNTNPFSEKISIDLPPTNGQATFRLLDVTGKTVFSSTEKMSGQRTVILNLKGRTIANGIYLLEAIVNNERTVTKLVKQ